MTSLALWHKIVERSKNRPKGLKPSHDPELRARVDLYFDALTNEASNTATYHPWYGTGRRRIWMDRPFDSQTVVLNKQGGIVCLDIAPPEWKRARESRKAKARF